MADRWMDIEAKLSEACWAVIESCHESEDILDCLGMGFHVLLDGTDVLMASPNVKLVEQTFAAHKDAIWLNVDTGGVFF